MKIRSSVKRLCGFCKTLRRGKKVFVKCEKYKRHNQRQGFSTLTETIDHTECSCHLKLNNYSSLYSFSVPQIQTNPNATQIKTRNIKEFNNYKL